MTMLVLAYFLAGGSIIFYFKNVPTLIPDELVFNADRPLKHRIGFIIGILSVLYFLFKWLEPEYGYSRTAWIFPLLLLFTATSLLLWALIEVQSKVKTYYSRTYNAVMTETKDVQCMLEEANTMSLQLATREEQLLLLDSEVETKTATIEEQSDLLEQLKAQLAQREKTITQKEEMINRTIQEAIKNKEQGIRIIYEEKLRCESDRLQQNYHEKMVAFVNNATTKMEQRISSEKKQVLDDVFQFDGTPSNDVFELKQAKEALEKEREEMEKNQFFLDVDKKVALAGDHVMNAKQSALDIRSENIELRANLKVMASEFKMGLNEERVQREKSTNSVLHQLELDQERYKSNFRSITDQLAVMDAQAKARLTEAVSNVYGKMKDLELKTSNGFKSVREKMSSIQLQFGKEVMRLDGQQGKILNELEKYYVKNQQFVNQCQSIALEARKQNIDGHHLLNQVNHIHSQHKLEVGELESRLCTSLDQVALKEGQLANSVGESMLRLKSISDQQYTAMKDLALEKKDIGLLWKEKNIEHEMNLQEVKHQKGDLDRTRQLFSQEKSAFNQHKSSVMENAKLTHQSYMKEQEHLIAMQKARNSGGFLSRWARNFDEIRRNK